MSVGNTTEDAIMNLTFRAVAWGNYADNAATSPETNISFALHTADPGDAGTQQTSEAAYTSYARVNVARTTGGFSASSNGSVSPAAAINFPVGTGGSGTGTHFSSGKASVATTAAILWSGTLTPNVTFGTGVQPQMTTSTTLTLD